MGLLVEEAMEAIRPIRVPQRLIELSDRPQ